MNEKGYDAVFAEQWKAELSECDIDPEAVSVDSEAHDMENGRDGLDGNAPEKDAPLRNTRKRKGRSLTTSPPANGVCILSTPESVTVSMVA